MIVANLGLRVIVLQPDAHSVAHDVNLQANTHDRFSVSENGRLLAAALSSEAFCCVEVLDLARHAIVTPESREDATMLRVERTHALDTRWAPDNETLFYWKHGARPGTYAIHLPSGQQQRIPKATFVSKGAWLIDSVVLPLRRGEGGVRITYGPLTVNPVELPSKSNVWHLAEHPSTETIALLDARGHVAGLRADTLEPFWRRQIPGAGWITYSGDGRFIAALQHAPGGGCVERIVLLDGKSGEIARVLTIEQPEQQARYPLEGPRFLCLSGHFLNAETGEFEEGVSAPGFWKVIVEHRE